MENNKIIIHKIPLSLLLPLLRNLYDQGVDYVDIMGKNEDDEDHLGISVNQSYLEEDLENIKFPKIEFEIERGEEEEEEQEEEELPFPHPLNEEDLNDLI